MYTIIAIFIIVMIFLILKTFIIVTERENVIVERLGKYSKTLKPGFYF